MNFNQLAVAMPHILDTGMSVELISASGRGKSEFTHGLIASQSARTGCAWGIATQFLATQTPSDLLGYMVPGHDDKGRRISEFTMPPWMRTDDGGHVEDYKRGIIFLDEYGQAEGEVKKASAELILNGKLGPWKLPPGWSVIAASNRMGDRSGVTRSFDFVINRRLEVHIKDDFESWKDWAIAKGIDTMLISFAEQNFGLVFNDEVPKVQGPWCTPRSLVMANTLINSMRTYGADGTPGPLPTSQVAMELIAGLIGEGAAIQLFATVKLANALPKMADILADPANTIIPEEPDGRMLVTYYLAANANTANVDPIAAYISRFPKEFIAVWMKTVVKYTPVISSNKSVMALYMANSSLFTAVVASNA